MSETIKRYTHTMGADTLLEYERASQAKARLRNCS